MNTCHLSYFSLFRAALFCDVSVSLRFFLLIIREPDSVIPISKWKEITTSNLKTKIEIELLLLLQKKIRQATNQLKQIKSKLLGYINVKYDGKTLDFLTGITNDSLFPWIL